VGEFFLIQCMKCVDVSLRAAGEPPYDVYLYIVECRSCIRSDELLLTQHTFHTTHAHDNNVPNTGPAFVVFAITLISGVIYTWSVCMQGCKCSHKRTPHTHTRTHARTHLHHTHARTGTQTHTDTHTHAHTHTHIHTHARTQTHTHIDRDTDIDTDINIRRLW